MLNLIKTALMWLALTYVITTEALNGVSHEKHSITTDDGYILGMERLANPDSVYPYPILLMHGLLASSDCFLLNQRNESLAYLLYDSGFDVWLGNVRGNQYSRRHESLNADHVKFWRWSFDEMGKYDVPSMINYVLMATNSSKINYIGHSQGTVVLMSAVIQNHKDLKDKIEHFFALAPAAYVPDADSTIKSLTSITQVVDFFDNLLAHEEFGALDEPTRQLLKSLCRNHLKFCEFYYFFVMGWGDPANINFDLLPDSISKLPSGTSMQNMLHWSQMLQESKVGMHYYDYGWFFLNFYHYMWFTPPSYDFSKFDVPTTIFCGDSDACVSVRDCKTISNLLPNVKNLTLLNGYNHGDFVLSVNTQRDIFPPIFRRLSKLYF